MIESILTPASLGLAVSLVSEVAKLVPQVAKLGKRGLRLLVLALSAIAVGLLGYKEGITLDPALLVSTVEVYAASWMSYKLLISK